MPRLTRSLPKYRKHKPTGKAVVTLNGRDHYLGPHGTEASKSEYDRLIGEWLASGRRAVSDDDTAGMTVATVLAAYWRHAKTYYVKNGKPTNEQDAMRLVIREARALYGDTPAVDFGPLKLKAVRQRWIERGQARPTVNKNQRRLVRIFRWAVAEEMIPGSVIHSLAAVPGLKKGRCELPEPAPILPVDLAVVEATMHHLPPVTADMVRFQLLTGARPGEVCQLRPRDVDRSKDVWEYVVEGHKTQHHGRSRTVYIGPAAQAVLAPYLLRDENAVCFSMAESLEQRRQARADARKTPLSCGNRRGRRPGADRSKEKRQRRAQIEFDASSYRHAIHSACDAAFPAPSPLGRRQDESDAARWRRLTDKQSEELKQWQREKRWHPNQLRHARATEIRRDYGLEAAQVILGHAAANVTEVYAERDADRARAVARAIG